MATDVSEVQSSSVDSYITSDPFALSSLIALMMEAARPSEKSVDIQVRTRQYIPEDSELYTRRRENLKSRNLFIVFHHELLFINSSA
jgi:hypothetical protein